MKYKALLFCTLLIQASAHAQILPGQKLSDWAASYGRNSSGQAELSDKIGTMAFVSYVTGIAEALHASGKICLPEHTSGGQLVEIVGQYVQANADKWNDDGFQLVSVPLSQTFKCAKKRR